MPRKPRLFLPGATYHVYCRVARGEFVFDDVNEAAEFVDTARRVRDLDGWKILGWSICPLFLPAMAAKQLRRHARNT